MRGEGSEEGAGRAQLVRQGNRHHAALEWGAQSRVLGELQKGRAGEGFERPGGSLTRTRGVGGDWLVAGADLGEVRSREPCRWPESLCEPHAPCPHSLQANETFAFVGNVTHYAQVWLNISAEIRSSLERGSLQQHLHWLQQVQGWGG